MKQANTEIVKEFLLESFEALASVNDELTTYEKNPNDKELLNSIFRKVHTLKGSAGFLGLKKLQEITHSAESVLDLIREGKIHLNSEMIDAFLASFDCCMELLKNIEETGAEIEKDYGYIIKSFSSVLEKTVDKFTLSEGSEKIHKNLVDESFSEKIVEKIPIKLEEKKVEISPQPILKEVGGENTVQDAEKVGDSNVANSSVLTDSVVRVNVQLLDKIMNIVGELVLNRNQILQYANVVDSSELNRLSQQLNIITTELQTDIMTTRMQPVGSVLSKFERIVRDLSRSQNKKIKLEIIGKDTELDKTLLEAIRDPLTHLIRNSVDHGIELPEVRRLKGKSEEGKIVIKSVTGQRNL